MSEWEQIGERLRDRVAYSQGIKDTEERIIKLIEAQEVEGWFDRGLKQHFIALIKGENK